MRHNNPRIGHLMRVVRKSAPALQQSYYVDVNLNAGHSSSFVLALRDQNHELFHDL